MKENGSFDFIRDLKVGTDGIWRSSTLGGVSYPGGGNEELASIEEDSFWFQHRKNCILELAKKFHPTERFFDIGGGNGFMSLAFQELGNDTVLVEPGAQGVTIARARGVKKIIQASYQDLDITPGSLSSVGIFDVLEHVERDSEFLKSLYEKMAPQTRLFVTVPAFNILWSDTDDYAGHFRRYRISELVAKLKLAGFESEFSSYLFSFLIPPVFLRRTVLSSFKKNTHFTERRNKSDHLVGQNLVKKAIAGFLRWEQSRIRAGKPIPFGTSCLVVAKRV